MNIVTSHQNNESASMNADNYHFFRTEVVLSHTVRAPELDIPASFFEGLDECKKGEVISMDKALHEPHP